MAMEINNDLSSSDLVPTDLGSPDWAVLEFAGSDLGDRRLDARLVKVSKALYSKPQAPINQACEDWKTARAAYRFFENERVSARKIFLVHQQRTIERIRSQPIVLHIQDTVYLDYTRHPHTTGLGPIGTANQKLLGLVMHDTLSITPSGLSLGVLTHRVWARSNRPSTATQSRKSKSIQEKESRKWIDALSETARLMPEGVRDVTICDAEGDVFELFAAAQDHQREILVRAAQDRCLSGQDRKLWEFLQSQEVKGYLEVDVAAREKQRARKARVTVQFANIALKAPQHAQAAVKKKHKSIAVGAIYVRELDPPAEVEEPLEWMLLTNRPIQTLEEATQRIGWYKLRWNVETFHKILKSGCQVEKTQLETAQRIHRYLAVFVAIAYRILWITHISRVSPHAPCTVVLAPQEWKALYAKVHRSPVLPDEIPTARQAIRWIGSLGGHLGRKGDGEPGVTAIWRGWQRLTDLAELWLITHPQPHATPAPAATRRSHRDFASP